MRYFVAVSAIPGSRGVALFRSDPAHPSLVIKKIKGMEGIWEGRIDRDYRFTFHYDQDPASGETMVVFRNLDSHGTCLENR